MRRLAGVIAIALATSAHVGSPDAWFEGLAGPYTVTVHIQAPPVVPGIAVINVKPSDTTITRITAFVNTYDAEGGTPPPDELVPVADRPGWRQARLWVMNAGSNSVTVEVDGSTGKGSVVVPLAAVAQRRLAVSTPFAVMLVVIGGILVWGMLTIVGAAVRESTLDPGAVPDESRHRRARMAMARGAVVIAIVLTATTAWWRVEDRGFRERMYRPLNIATSIDSSSGTRTLVVTITDSTWLRRDEVGLVRARGEIPVTGLIDDHGKLMHLFLVSEDGRSAMAHLHPLSADTVSFSSALPPLPAGTYRVFGDVVHRTGFTQTLTSTLSIGATASGVIELSDPDDSWSTSSGSDGNRVTLGDGTALTWIRADNAPIRAGEEAGLRFHIERPQGDSAALESYLGMPGHAAVIRDDGRVFIHLHPMGTISPAAQARLSPASAHVMHSSGTATSDTLHFPYAFPEPGNYTVWVQLKRHGRILTGSFNAKVDP